VKGPLEELCVEDTSCPPGWLPAVKIALDMLAVPLGIRRMRRNERAPTGDKSPAPSAVPRQVSRAEAEFAAFAAVLHVDLNQDSEERIAAARSLFTSFKALYERERFRLDKTKDKG
jgi:hypothetical protein